MHMQWTIGQKCEIYLKQKRKWNDGEVVDIFNDDEGEWVKVRMRTNGTDRQIVEIHPDSPNIRPLTDDKPSEQDNEWTTGALCEVYSHEEREWIDGEIINTFTDAVGEWLRVQYGQRIRDVMSDDPLFRARGTQNIAVSEDVLKTLRKIVQKQPDLMPVFQGVLNQSADPNAAHSQS